MIWLASSKHKSMRRARMWNKMSPGVAIAWRAPARNSRNGCNSAGRGAPKRRSQTSDPKATMQDSRPLRSRNPTARKRFAMSVHKERTAVSASGPGLTVTTRKIAADVSGVATGCGNALACPARPGVVIQSVSVGLVPREALSRPARPARSGTRPCDRRAARASGRCGIAICASRPQPARRGGPARRTASRPSRHRQSTMAKPASRIVCVCASIPPIRPNRS